MDEKPTQKYRAIWMGRLYNEQMIPEITAHPNIPRLYNPVFEIALHFFFVSFVSIF
jgi:hypothetical protein